MAADFDTTLLPLMLKKRCARGIIYLRDFRACLIYAFLTIFSPRKLEALRSDKALARDVQRRWNGHSITVWCLVYERDDWMRFRAAQPDILEGLEAPDPTKGDFIVFLDSGFSIDWVTDQGTDPQAASLIASAEALAAADCDFLKQSKLLEFRLQVAQAIVCALQGEIEEGQKLLNQAKGYLAKRTVEQSREWTLLSLLLVGSIIATAASFWGKFAFVNGLSVTASTSMIGGFSGAFASMAARTGKGSWDAAAGFLLHFLEVTMRLLVGSVFGLVATSLAASSFGPEPFQTLIKSWEGCVVIAFGAGLFEHSIPRILSHYSREQAIGVIDENEKKSDTH